MTSDEAHARVREELVELVESGLPQLWPYVRDYADAMMNSTNKRVTRPADLHPVLARFGREVAWDVLTSAPLDSVSR